VSPRVDDNQIARASSPSDVDAHPEKDEDAPESALSACRARSREAAPLDADPSRPIVWESHPHFRAPDAMRATSTTTTTTTRAPRERARANASRHRRDVASTRRARARRAGERCAMTSSSAAAAGPSGAPRERYGVTEKYWTWRGHTIRYTCAGDSGEPVVLVHGFGGNADHWRRNVNALSARGRRVFAIDLLGYGYSDKPDPMRPELKQNEIYCFETWGAQICDFVDDVVGAPAFVACNSVGGVAGLQAAVDAPEKVRGIVLMNISLRGLHITKQPPFARPFVKALQRTLRETAIGKSFFGSVAKARTVKNILKEAYGDSSQVTDELVEAILTPGLRDGAAEVFLDFISYSGGPLPEELLPKCTVPVRMFWGDKDPWENIDEGRKLYASYADKFIPLPGVGHCPQDEAPELVNALLNEFIDDYAAAA